MLKKNISFEFTILTFIIMLIGWGLCIACGLFGITLNSHFWLYIPYTIGGCSPAIASYIILKKFKQVTGLKEWLKNVFKIKNPTWMYLLVIMFCIAYFVPQILISGLERIYSIYMLFIYIPIMLFAGGLEETGWRYVLQPELERKYGFVVSSIFVAIIWAVWHLPLFFIPGIAQYGVNFWLFALNVLGMTFALGALSKITKSVFMCVLFHCLINAASSVFVIKQTMLNSIFLSIELVIVSSIAVIIFKHKSNKHEHI